MESTTATATFISLDGVLCPKLVKELTEKDWEHNVHEDNRVDLFRDLDYVLQKFANDPSATIFAIMPNPTSAGLKSFSDPKFAFCGFDLVNSVGGISALVNCGGFEEGSRFVGTAGLRAAD